MSERFRCRRIECDCARIERTKIVGGLPHIHGEHASITI